MTEFDETGAPKSAGVPAILDKLGPVQAMSKRRTRWVFEGLTAKVDAVFPIVNPAREAEERQMFIDALEFVEVYSEDGFSRIMARTALGRRSR